MPESRFGRKDWPPLKRGPSNLLEWASLKKGSKQGLVMLLMSLSWWDAQATRKADRTLVSSALKDVLFVMRQLVANESEDDSSALRKRARGPESVLPPMKR